MFLKNTSGGCFCNFFDLLSQRKSNGITTREPDNDSFRYIGFLYNITQRFSLILMCHELVLYSRSKFCKTHRKHPSKSLIFNKVAGCLRPATLLKEGLWHRCFLWILQDFWEHLFTEHLRWLILIVKHNHRFDSNQLCN